MGLFGVNLEEHREHRRLVMPAFHTRRVGSYLDTMVEVTESCLDGWRTGEQRNMMQELRVLTMRIATRTLFGADIGERGRRIGPLLQRAFNALVHPLSRLFPYDVPGLPFHRFLTLIGVLDSEMRRIIEQKCQADVKATTCSPSCYKRAIARAGLRSVKTN